MNAQMRRYLDEDWDEEVEVEAPKRDRKPPNPIAQSRRQASKEFGRAMAKFHRSRDKERGKQGKP